jgi:hypothetical protein
MSKRKRGRTTKAQASSKVRPQAARGGEHTRRANSKQARDRFKLGNANRDGRYLVRL